MIPDWCIDWLDIVLCAVFDLTLCYTELQKSELLCYKRVSYCVRYTVLQTS